jgi:hypothetical protein
MWVRIVCSDESVSFEGEWEGSSHVEVLELAKREAVSGDMPVQVEIQGWGVWSITPDGRAMPAALFHDKPDPRDH